MVESPERVESLREVRLRRGLSQLRLAELSGVAQQHISAIENHRLLLTDERAGRLAPHLATHPTELVVHHYAARVLQAPNRRCVEADDFRALIRAFSAVRHDESLNPQRRLQLIRVVRTFSDALVQLWQRLLDDAERAAVNALGGNRT